MKLVVDVDKESFFASSKVLKSEGYLQVANPPKKKSFEESNARILGKTVKLQIVQMKTAQQTAAMMR